MHRRTALQTITQAETEMDRQTDRQLDRQTDRQPFQVSINSGVQGACLAGLATLACLGAAAAMTCGGRGLAVSSSSSCRRLCARSGGLTHTQLLLELAVEEVLEFSREIGSRMV